MAGAVGVSFTKLGEGRLAVAFLALSLVLCGLCFLGPLWLLRTGQPGGVVTVAVAQLVMSLGAVPGTVPASVVAPNLFLACLLFAPVSLYILIVLWLPSGRAYVEARRDGDGPEKVPVG